MNTVPIDCWDIFNGLPHRIDQEIAVRAGELRLRYDIHTVDSLIAATGIVENIRHILTDYDHFDPFVNLIKPIDMKKALKLARQYRRSYFNGVPIM